MGSEYILTRMEESMRDFGLIIVKMDMDLKNGRTEAVIKAILNLGLNKDKVFINGVMGAIIRATGKTIIFKDMANMFGKMEGPTKDYGEGAKCMEKESIHGKMEEGMKESTKMIRNMAVVNTIGLMVKNFRALGLMAKGKVEEFLHIPMGK